MGEVSGLLRAARRRAGLSQRALAERANTAQSVIARIESGSTSPTLETLERLLRATGFELDTGLRIATVSDSHMLADVERILSLSPEARLAEVANVSRFLASARKVGSGDE